MNKLRKAFATLILFLTAATFLFQGCTAQQRARTFGGNAEEALPCDQKVFDVTWKGTDLWVATIPMEPDDVPRTVTFQESSSFGLAEGTVTFKESRCK